MNYIEFIIVAVFLGLMCIILMYRVAKGPHVVDRVVAADSIDAIISTIMVIVGAISGRSIYLDLALIAALLPFIDTMMISRYLEGKL